MVAALGGMCVTREDRCFFLPTLRCIMGADFSMAAQPCAPHKVALCVFSLGEWGEAAATAKHIPFCPAASAAQTQTQGLNVYQASPGKTADLGPLLGSLQPPFHRKSLSVQRMWSAELKSELQNPYNWRMPVD